MATEREELLRRLGWSDELIDACMAAPLGSRIDRHEIQGLATRQVSTATIIVDAGGRDSATLEVTQPTGTRL